MQLFDKSYGAGAALDCGDSDLNGPRSIVKESADWFAANDLDFIKRYERGDLEIVVKLRLGLGAKEYDLIFAAMPCSVGGEPQIGRIADHLPFVDNRSVTCGRQEDVLVSQTYFVECPQKVIPSFVRLERSKDREDLLRDILAPALHVAFEGGSTTTDREVRLTGLSTPASDSKGVNGVIESSAQIVGGITNDLRQLFRDRLGDFDLPIDVARQFRIRLDSTLAWIFLKEGVDIALEDFDVVLTPRQLAL